MLNFKAIRDEQITVGELIAHLSQTDLTSLTHEMVNAILGLISGCEDADVIFDLVDPSAYDPHAATPKEVHMPWSLGHVIVHITASSEEAAVIGMELARGVAFHGRSRYEIPWEVMKTITQCRERLEESRRMRLASLEMWPQPAHLDLECQAWPGGPKVNAVGRFVLGLMHDDSHLGQIAEIVRQAKAARGR
jgi:hypothetical protein